MGYKAGMTHVVRYRERRQHRKIFKKDVVEPVTIIETPPIKIVGVVGYIQTPRGLRALTTVWAQNLTREVLRRFYKNWMDSKRKAFSKYQEKWQDKNGSVPVERELARIVKYCDTVRVIAHTQVHKLNLRQKKAHIFEVQVNGGSIADKVQWAKDHLEKEVKVSEVFEQDENIDVLGVTKGKGVEGVTTRWGVTRLPRKTHRGLRKVACIGAWHPAAVQWSVARSGQRGYHHRTQINNKIYRIGSGAVNGTTNNAYCENDMTEKNITPVGGFPHYGVVNEDFIMIRGQCMGTKKRPITLRKALFTRTDTTGTEKIELKFIDTSSKLGHGRFQTLEEKNGFFGPLKKNLEQEAE